MTMPEIYAYAEKIGVMVFSTIHENEVQSRIAHFNGFDDEGIYFRTMDSKPYYRQLIKTKKVTVCGITDTKILDHEEDGTPVFPTSYSFRLVGEIRQVPPEVIKEKAKTNKALRTAAQDIDKYPTMTQGNFIIYKGKVEIYDADFECVTRDHKLLRTRAAFGGATYREAGKRITDKCIACGKCMKACTFKAIEKGQPYRIIPERCDDCGSCALVCPAGAIEESQTF